MFGVPDQKYGEEVCAWVVLRPGEQATAEEIREFCRGADRPLQDSALYPFRR